MAKHDKLTLPIAKEVKTTDYYILKYSNTERGKSIDVVVQDIDGTPYDLTGLDIFFVEELYNDHLVIDDGKENSAGKFITTDDDLKNGQFTYQFQEDVYQYDGWAHFKFKKNGNLVDTTAGFAIKIIDDVDGSLDEDSYVSYFEKIKEEHQVWINKAKELLSQQQELNDSNNSKIAVLNKSLTDLNHKVDDLATTVTDNHNALTSRIDILNNEKEQLKAKNSEQDRQISSLNSEKDQLNQKVNDLTTAKNNLVTEINNAKNANAELKSRVQTLENKQFIAHVASEDQVASQTAPIVIVDD